MVEQIFQKMLMCNQIITIIKNITKKIRQYFDDNKNNTIKINIIPIPFSEYIAASLRA